MTVRITKDQKIGGVSARWVRDILRKLHRHDSGGESFDRDWLAEELYWLRVKDKYEYQSRDICLYWLNSPNVDSYIYYPDCLRQWNVSRRASAAVIKALVADGLIELNEKATTRAGAPRYTLTEERGEDFCRATAAKPVHRKSADEAIQGFMDRVRIVNESDRFLYRVTAVVLYGSFARGAERPADVDLAIKLEPKISDPEEYEKAEQAYLKDRVFRSLMDELFAPERDVKTFLRQRKRTLSLHSMHDFIGMKKHGNFSYEVLFGDKDKIAERLARGRTPTSAAIDEAGFVDQDRDQGEYEQREPR